MSKISCNCNSQCDCSFLAIVASIVIGIIAAFLTITGVIATTPVFLWVTFGIAVVYLGLTLVASPFFGRKGCICRVLSILFTGILGTILASVILLAITFAATSIVGAIITGLLLLLFSLMLTSTACLVKCIANCADSDTQEN